jgi:hypothetical protein
MRTGSGEVWSRLAHLYRDWLDAADDAGVLASIEVSCDAARGSWTVEVTGSAASCFDTWEGAVVGLQYHLDALVVRTLQGHALVHAGVVLVGESLVLLPGPSGSGKSSLVAHLVARGARYYSDELAILDAEGRVHPYRRPLMLRGARGSYPDTSVRCDPPSALPAQRPEIVLFLTYDPIGAAGPIVPVTKERALMELLRNTPQNWRDRPRLVPTLARALAGTRTFAGGRGEAGEMDGPLARLLAGRRPQA